MCYHHSYVVNVSLHALRFTKEKELQEQGFILKGRLKEFRLLNHVLPINMTDLCDLIWNVAGAIVNMQPALVK